MSGTERAVFLEVKTHPSDHFKRRIVRPEEDIIVGIARIAAHVEGHMLIPALKEPKPTQCIPREKGAKSTHNLIAEADIGSGSRSDSTEINVRNPAPEHRGSAADVGLQVLAGISHKQVHRGGHDADMRPCNV